MAVKLAVVLGLLLLSGGASAPLVPWNAFNRQWGTGFEDSAAGVAVQGPAVYVVGVTRGALPGQVSAGNWDPFVRRYDTGGNEIWTRQFGATDFAAFDIAAGVAAVPGAAYIVGATAGTLPGQVSRVGFDAFIRKYDEEGNELWTRQFGGPPIDFVGADDFATAVAADATGVYVIGETETALDEQVDAGGIDAFIRKYDHDGNILWTHQFGTAEDDSAASVAIDATGVYLVGDTQGSLPGQTKTSPEKEAYVRKYDSGGNELWTRQFDTGPVNIARQNATSVAVYDGIVYIGGLSAGVMPGAPVGGGFFIRAYDTHGTLQWTRQSSGHPPVAWRTAALAVDAAGITFVSSREVALAGAVPTVSEWAFARRYDLAGTERWTRYFVAAGATNAVAAHGGAIYLAGESSRALPGHEPSGQEDAFLVKIFESTDVDDVPPTIVCPPAPAFFFNTSIFQPAALKAAVMDAGSGALAADIAYRVPTSEPGPQELSASAMDWAGNVSVVSCSFSVVFKFAFDGPAVLPPAVNIAVAGATIPVRWIVADASDRRIPDFAHFRGISLRTVPCVSDAPTSVLDDSSEPPPGLSFLFDQPPPIRFGYWQFGWETEKHFKNKDACQEFTLDLADQVPGRVLLFRFEKDKQDKDK